MSRQASNSSRGFHYCSTKAIDSTTTTGRISARRESSGGKVASLLPSRETERRAVCHTRKIAAPLCAYHGSGYGIGKPHRYNRPHPSSTTSAAPSQYGTRIDTSYTGDASHNTLPSPPSLSPTYSQPSDASSFVAVLVARPAQTTFSRWISR